MLVFGRRNVKPGDVVAIDTPYLNGTAKVVAGPDYEKGTKAFPKYLFEMIKGVVVDPETKFVSELDSSNKIWLEDNAKYISIFGVDDNNIRT